MSLWTRGGLGKGSRGVTPTPTQERTTYFQRRCWCRLSSASSRDPAHGLDMDVFGCVKEEWQIRTVPLGFGGSILGFKVGKQERKCLRGPRNICSGSQLIHKKIWILVESTRWAPAVTSPQGHHLPIIILIFYSTPRPKWCHYLAQVSPQPHPIISLNYSGIYFHYCLNLFRLL